jgi:hypothetical protein
MHVTTDPQFRDIISQFLDTIKDEKSCYEPDALREKKYKNP